MRFTIDSTHGLYAAADTAEEAVTVLRHHLEDHQGEPNITFLVVAPGGQQLGGTVISWSDHPDPADTLDSLLTGATDDLTAATAHR